MYLKQKASNRDIFKMHFANINFVFLVQPPFCTEKTNPSSTISHESAFAFYVLQLTSLFISRPRSRPVNAKRTHNDDECSLE